MRRTAHLIKTTVSVTALVGCLGMIAPLTASAADAATIEKGKKLAFDRKKGNCLACHQIEGGTLAGNIGPPLVAMKARFPDYEKMKAQIADPRTSNPNSIMIPFGPHKVLTAEEIELVSQFIYTL
jgi:sulfur-oxidizing protein SoxX